MQEQKNEGFFQTYTSENTPKEIVKEAPAKSVTLPISPIKDRDSGRLGIVLDAIFDLSKLFLDFLLKFTNTILRGFKYICWGFLGLSVSFAVIVITCVGGIYAFGIHETEDFSQFQEKLIGNMNKIVGLELTESLDSDTSLNLEKRIVKSEDECMEGERFYRGHCISIPQ